MTQLIALAAIAAGTLAEGSAEIAPGTVFEAPVDKAAELLGTAQAELAAALLTEAKKPAAVKIRKVRVLIDCALGRCNDVVELDAAALKDAEAAGLADPDKAAVAYAMTLAQNA